MAAAEADLAAGRDAARVVLGAEEHAGAREASAAAEVDLGAGRDAARVVWGADLKVGPAVVPPRSPVAEHEREGVLAMLVARIAVEGVLGSSGEASAAAAISAGRRRVVLAVIALQRRAKAN